MEPERCDECGFDGTRLTINDAITSLRSLGRRWRALFDKVPEDVLRERPAPDVWSALEYAAHTRDVIALNAWGINEALTKDRPVFPKITPDVGAPDHGYNRLQPSDVLDELAVHAGGLADKASHVLPAHWDRVAVVGDQEIDAGWALRHVVHDATHHLKDVEKGLEALQGH
jgi:hypothetical protein